MQSCHIQKISPNKSFIVALSEKSNMARERILAKFGKAAEEKDNLCRPSEEDVYLEPSQSLVDDEEGFWIESIEKAAGLTRPVLKYKAARADDDFAAPSTSSGATSAQATNGKYVPPSRRDGASRPVDEDRDDRTLRVTNLGETVKEGDLTELFSKCGRVVRCFVAKNLETKACRGFAFVSMATREAAQKAIDTLNGHGYDHLILKVEWAKP